MTEFPRRRSLAFRMPWPRLLGSWLFLGPTCRAHPKHCDVAFRGHADDIIHALIAYSFVGVVHFIFRDKFIEISEDQDAAAKKGLKVRWWVFCFICCWPGNYPLSRQRRVAGLVF